MEKEIKNWKNDYKRSQLLENLIKNEVLGKEKVKSSRKAAGIRMLDLRTEILYGEKYLKIFITELTGQDITEAEKKYNIRKVNEHLENILKEYTQMTDELDAVIFKEKDNMHTCSICGKYYEGYGNSAQPINNGRCCNNCDNTIVTPRRMKDVINKQNRRNLENY